MNRLGFIGGSDIAAILGVSSYKTAYQLYLEKLGLAQQDEETEWQYWGKTLEPLVREHFKASTGFAVTQPDAIVHPQYPFLIGHLDGFIEQENAVLEIKCASDFMRYKWAEAVPGMLTAESGHTRVLLINRQFRKRLDLLNSLERISQHSGLCHDEHLVFQPFAFIIAACFIGAQNGDSLPQWLWQLSDLLFNLLPPLNPSLLPPPLHILGSETMLFEQVFHRDVGQDCAVQPRHATEPATPALLPPTHNASLS